MAPEARKDARGVELLAAIAKAPHRYGLFQALRRIECAFREHALLGTASRAADEPIRLSQEPSLAFEPSEISGVRWGQDGIARLQVAVLGLLGANGPLPLHLTEYARERLRNEGDPTLARFLDVFNHRMLSFYYRAFANTQPAFGRDREDTDRFPKYVGAQLGMALPSLRNRDEIPDRLRLMFAGILAGQTRNADGLAAIVESYFGVRTRIESHVGEWVEIPPNARWRLGRPGVGSPLGRRTAIGRRAWIVQGKFRVVMGPMGIERRERLLPGGPSLPKLAAVVREYAGDQLAWDLMLVLDDSAKRPWQLGGPSRLGSTCWLGTSPRRIIVDSSLAVAGARRDISGFRRNQRPPD